MEVNNITVGELIIMLEKFKSTLPVSVGTVMGSKRKFWIRENTVVAGPYPEGSKILVIGHSETEY